MIAAIGAVSSNGMIGLDGWLPWDIPEELAFFEKTVAGAALVIGLGKFLNSRRTQAAAEH